MPIFNCYRCLSVLVAFLCVWATAPAQHTVFEDAKVLQQSLAEQPVPSVKLTGGKLMEVYQSPAKQAFGKDSTYYGQLSPDSRRPLTLEGHGIYKLFEVLDPFVDSQQLEVIYGMDTLSFPVMIFDTVIIAYQANLLRLTTQQDGMIGSDTTVYSRTFVEAYAVLLENTPELAAPEDYPNDYYRVLARLRPYVSNPFFAPWLAEYRLDALPYPDASTDSTVVAILQELAERNSPPVEILPAEEELPVQALSLKAVELSYRSPATTATRALQDVTQQVSAKQQTNPARLDANAVIIGLSDFVVDRAEDEFNIAFMERFRDLLQSRQFLELRTLFPNAASFFTNDLDIIEYKTLLPLAKQAFTKDMQNMGIHFANLLELDGIVPIENDPTVYNMALFYEMANLAYQGASLDTILQNTHLRLDGRKKELFKKGNLSLAENPEARPKIDDLEEQVRQLSATMDTLSKLVDARLAALETDFFGLQQLAEANGQGAEAKSMYEEYYAQSGQRASAFYRWRGGDKIDLLERIAFNLDGNRDYQRMLERQPQVEKFPRLFDQIPDSVQLVAAGLDLTRRLVAQEDERGNGMVSSLVELYRFLENTEEEVQNMSAAISANTASSIRSEVAQFEADRQQLQKELNTEADFWRSQQRRRYRNGVGALDYLSAALDPDNDPTWIINTDSSAMKTQLDAARAKYTEAMRYAVATLQGLDTLGDPLSALLPKLQQQLNGAAVAALTYEEPLIEQVYTQMADVRLTLKNLDATYNRSITVAEQNAAGFQQIVDLSAHLLYCLRAPEYYDSTGQVIDTTRWLDRQQFRDILRDAQQRDLYMGLIYNQLQEVADQRLSSQGVATVTTQFLEIVNEASVYRDSIRAVRPGEKLTFVDYFPFVRLSMDMLNTLILTPLNLDGVPLHSNLSQIPVVTDQALSLFENVYAEEYNYAIYNVVELYKAITAGLEGDTTRAGDVRDNIIRYGTFIANVAVAQQSQDVRAALVAAALPPGSSRIKRQSRRNISVNAYMGFGAGAEQFTDNVPGVGQEWAGLGTLSVPIGLSYSRKFNMDSKWSYTFFLPVLDLGAVTSFRIDDDEGTNSLPELSLQNVIAPGGFLLANRDRTPFSFGLGAQYGPQLRSVTSASGEVVEASAWRVTGVFLVDVPVFNLFTQKGKR